MFTNSPWKRVAVIDVFLTGLPLVAIAADAGEAVATVDAGAAVAAWGGVAAVHRRCNITHVPLCYCIDVFILDLT